MAPVLKDFQKFRDFMDFKIFITHVLVRIVWEIEVAAALLWIVFGGFMYGSPSFGSRFGISLVALVASRLAMELFVVLFSIANLLREIRDQRKDA